MEVQPRIISAEAVLSGFETKFPLNFLGPTPPAMQEPLNAWSL